MKRLFYLGLAIGVLCAVGQGAVAREKFQAGGRYLIVETLSDEVIHFEVSAVGAGPDVSAPIYTSPYVAKTPNGKYEAGYRGPEKYSRRGNTIETRALRVEVSPDSLCLSFTDLTKKNQLTRICPLNLKQDWKGLTLDPGAIKRLYGLGEQFLPLRVGSSDGDWMGQIRYPGSFDDGKGNGHPYGNAMVAYAGGFTGNAQFPILYALGDHHLNYAFLFDNVYKQRWDFTQNPWRVESWGDQLRGFFLAGADLQSLRESFMDLAGHPLVPPKKAFGLWVSEFGYRGWWEIDEKLKTLRANHFPLDGFMLDLQWYGNVTSNSENSRMGALTFDERPGYFPSPRDRIRSYWKNDGIGFIPIEEPYVARGLPEHAEMASQGLLAKSQPGMMPSTDAELANAFFVDESGWWGLGGMVDFTNPRAGRKWHEEKRQPLIDLGIVGHWTDLSEPDEYRNKANLLITPFYYGFPELGKFAQADVHNIYALKWSESIYDGYRESRATRRPFILSRSGGVGIQRYGTAMWSGDIGSNMGSLATHYNAQMHLSFSGIDYFGADVGGFHREALDGDLNELYQQWFADASAFDVPVRPHTFNLGKNNETAPDRVGDLKSNLASIRSRYELSPYYYSLAYRAWLFGEPVIAPLVYYYQDAATDRPNNDVRAIGDEKLVGRDILVGLVAQHGEKSRQIYLPPGEWFDYHTSQKFTSTGTTLDDYPEFTGGIFQLPTFVKAGAIIPKMFVDDNSMNILGKRGDQVTHSELIARVYPAVGSSEFTLYEDDGLTNSYRVGNFSQTTLKQRQSVNGMTVVIGATRGRYDREDPNTGVLVPSPANRINRIELVSSGLPIALQGQVLLNGVPLKNLPSTDALAVAESGWCFSEERRIIVAKSSPLPVSSEKRFEFSFPGL